MGDSPLDLASMWANIPDGLVPGADRGSLAVGTVTGVDVVARQVQVTVGASDPLWVPAAPDIYVAGALVRLQRSPLDGGRAFYCMGTLDVQPEIVSGTVTAVNAGTGTLTVAVLSASYDLPYVAGTYSVSTVVLVQRSVKQFGAPILVLGPTGSYAGESGTPDTGGTTNPGQTENRQAVIGPQWSGSYRASYGWDRWNLDRHGGRSTLWQGNGFGSGVMTGLATYGEQIVNLGATAITSMVVRVTRADNSSTTGKAPSIQPATDGTQPGGAPSAAGTGITGIPLVNGQSTDMTIPSVNYPSYLSGAYKGVAMVGSDYAGFAGTSRGDGMLLIVQYTVVV